MTEQKPKFEIGSVVLVPLENGEKQYGIVTDSSYRPEGTSLYWVLPKRKSDGETTFFEKELSPVKIIPITDKPYCKDCKHFPEIGKEGYWLAYWCSCECPIFAWAQQAVEPCGSRLNTSRTQIGNDNYNVELLQPPDNCNCFDPKETR